MPVNDWYVLTRYLTRHTLDTGHSTCFASLTRLSRSMATRSSALQLAKQLVTQSKPHISQCSRIGIRFVLFRLRSTLLAESLLLSFPAGTRMLRFPAFPFLTEPFRNPRFNACMRLAVAYRSLPRPSMVSKPSHPLYGLQNS